MHQDDRLLPAIIATTDVYEVESEWKTFRILLNELDLELFAKCKCLSIYGHDNLDKLTNVQRMRFMSEHQVFVGQAVLQREVKANGSRKKT